jgi:hypothetical protein
VIDGGETLGCLTYERFSTPPWDSIDVDTVTKAVLDTARIALYDGTMVVRFSDNEACGRCGDPNDDGDVGNILDLTFLVDAIFRGGPQPDPLRSGEMNCDGEYANIIDLTFIVDAIFRGGPAVCPGC